jgi:hypothetical protein
MVGGAKRRGALRCGAVRCGAEVVDCQPTSEPEAQGWGVGPEGPRWLARLSAAQHRDAVMRGARPKRRPLPNHPTTFPDPEP